jgi:hypothetical protein
MDWVEVSATISCLINWMFIKIGAWQDKKSTEGHLSRLDWMLGSWKSAPAHWLTYRWDWIMVEQLSGSHLLTHDRVLHAHVHIGAAKSGLELHHFQAQYASDTSPPRETTVSISTRPSDFNVRACCNPDMISDRWSGGESRSGCADYF